MLWQRWQRDSFRPIGDEEPPNRPIRDEHPRFEPHSHRFIESCVLSLSMLMSRYETSNHLTPPRVANGRVADSASGDRFIASRSATDFDYAHHLLTETQQKTGDGESSCSPSKLAYRKIMAENLTGRSGDGNTRILHYTGKAPANSHGKY